MELARLNKKENMKNLMLAVLMLFIGLGTAKAQTTNTVVAAPFVCIDQNSFYCYNVPVTVNGTPTFMTLDLFAYSYGYVVFNSPQDYFNNLVIVKGPLDSNGHFSTLQIADKSGDLLLNLDVTWRAQSSGGGRGSHNVIWRPIISTSSTLPSYYISAN